MLKDFGADEYINQLAGKPEFIAALLILLEISLSYYTVESVESVESVELSTGRPARPYVNNTGEDSF